MCGYASSGVFAATSAAPSAINPSRVHSASRALLAKARATTEEKTAANKKRLKYFFFLNSLIGVLTLLTGKPTDCRRLSKARKAGGRQVMF